MYGEVSTLYQGNQPCILTGYETFKEAFVEQADIFTDRPYFPVNDMLSKGKGLPFDPQHLVTSAVANIISGLVFGHMFEYDDHQFHLMQKYVDDMLQLPISNWGRLYNQFPTLMSLLPGKHQTAFTSMSKLQPFLQEEFRKHKEERDPSNPRDYIDCYLDEIEKGVMVLPLLKTILQGKNEYSTPNDFNPSHFLDENGMFLKKDTFIPFSIAASSPLLLLSPPSNTPVYRHAYKPQKHHWYLEWASCSPPAPSLPSCQSPHQPL
ncbi:unnamed protein product [Leuciscus chuanchicus]